MDKLGNTMNREEIQEFLTHANEISLALFKESEEFIDDYVKTTEMTKKDKLKDIKIMIDHFIDEERYEDCALLVKIKDKIKKYYNKQKTESYE